MVPAAGVGGRFAEHDITSEMLLTVENNYDGQGILTVFGDELVYNQMALLPASIDISFTVDVSMSLVPVAL